MKQEALIVFKSVIELNAKLATGWTIFSTYCNRKFNIC